MDNEVKKLYIPVNVKTKFEIYEGFGTAELISTVLCSIPASLVLFLIKTVLGKSFGFFALGVMVIFIASAFIFVRDRTNQNVVDYVKNILIFNGRQKRYIYNKRIEVEELEQIEIARQRERRSTFGR